MSYARFSNADVYIFMSTSGYLECCGCWLQETRWVEDPTWPITGGYAEAVEPIIETRFTTTQGMVDHVALHRAAGHDVPAEIEAELWADDRANWVDYRRCAVDGCEERVTCGSPTPDGYVQACSVAHAQTLGGFADWPRREAR
ncbi:MAG TPA: hypothetical protein VF062_19530 [Candidatus Limnocylindrales bacterium]